MVHVGSQWRKSQHLRLPLGFIPRWILNLYINESSLFSKEKETSFVFSFIISRLVELLHSTAVVVGISKPELTSLVNLAPCVNCVNIPRYENLHPFLLISFIGK